jgi:hypothetical protein
MTAIVEAAGLPTEGGKWIGRNISPLEIASILFVGTVGILFAGLQPQLLGALVAEGRLTPTELGWAATAELLTVGAAAGIAGGVLKSTHLRWWGAGASLALVAIDFFTRGQSHAIIIANRAAAGVAEGILLWIPVSMIARSTTPARWSGVFLVVQTLAQFLYSEILPATVMVKLGATGGFYALAATSLVSAGVAFLIPRSFDPLPHQTDDRPSGAMSLATWLSLASVFLFMAFTVGFWSYLEPISAEARHPAYVYNQAASLALFAQVAGAFLASLIAGRISFFPVVLFCTIGNLVVLAIVATMPGPVVFIALAGLFGFLWLFLIPFQVPMLIEADPTRRAAVLMPGAQLLGAASGPMVCSFAVVGTDVRGVLAVCAVSLVLAFLVAGWLHWRKHT